MGNIGLPSPNYVLKHGTSDLGFRFYPYPYQNDIFLASQASYYQSVGPYACLTGVSGSKKLQILKLFFTQTYKGRLNIAVKFNRYTSLGYYLKQQTYTNNFCLTSNYVNKTRHSGYYFYFITNGNKNQENGGIVGDALSESTVALNKNLLPVKISSATRDNKEFRVMLNPWVKLNRGADSNQTLNHYVQVKSRFNFNIYKYKDANVARDNFYTLMYLDTARTYDSSRVMQLINEASYSLVTAKKNNGVSLGYRNELTSVYQKADSSFMNNMIFADAVFGKTVYSNDSLRQKKLFAETRLNAQYIFNGPNSGNYKIESRSELVLFKQRQHRVLFNVLFENRSADYIYNYWVSNNYTWFNNGYGPQQQLQLHAGYTFHKKLGLTLIAQNISNYLYFDNVAQPRQYNKDLQALSARAWFSIVLFKHLGFYAEDIVQQVSNTSYMSLPGNIATARLFYKGSHYKNNFQLQTGFQLQYYQSFYGYGYTPATQVFYLQDRFTTGQYPFLDFYLNARIRPVNVFIRIENLLQGYAGSKYSFVPGYYQPDRAFRFGISWMFFD